MTTQPVIAVDELLHFAGWGWRLFPTHSVIEGRCTCGRHPCGVDNKNAGKHPRIKEWQKNATTDRATIERWWQKWPQSNWAVACGATRGSAGLVVFDIDTPANAATLEGLARTHGALPETLQATTGRGRHLYFDGDVGGSHTIGDDKLLVRGEGGYVILPGSLHASGRRYAWVDPAAPLGQLPEWLREWVVTAGNTKAVAPAASSQVELGTRPTYLINQQDLSERALKGIGPEYTKDEVAQALARIPADCSMETWLNVARALHDWDSGEIGLFAFKFWSARSANPNHADGQEVAEKEWHRIKKAKPGKRMIHIASLFVEAAKYPPTEVQQAQATSGQVNGNHSEFAHAVSLSTEFQEAGGTIRRVAWIDTDDEGAPRATCANAAVAIGGLGVACRHDTFHDRLLVGGHFIQQWAGDLTDNAVLMLRRHIKRHFRFDPGEKNTRDAAVQLCLENAFDPVRSYLESLVWDKTPRLPDWLTTYMSAPADPLTHEFARLVLVAAVRRVYTPGCKFDEILVLEGPEGKGKSSALRILAGDENFSDARVLGASEREQLENTTGVWLHEISELAGLRRTEVEHVKAFCSRQEDRARPAYGRFRVDRPRRCVFIATTNSRTYLRSDTGDRRFWPTETGRIDTDALARDRDQLWAEAVARHKAGESIRLDARYWPVAAELQASRQEQDPWMEGIGAWIRDKRITDISVREVMENHLRMQPREYGQAEQNRVARTLQQLNFERYQKREGETRLWRYRRPLNS